MFFTTMGDNRDEGPVISIMTTTERDCCVNEINLADNGGRRKSGDRRNFCYTIHIPERRLGTDRRAGSDRRQHARCLDDK